MDNASCGDGSSVDDMYFRGENGRICGNGTICSIMIQVKSRGIIPIVEPKVNF